MSTGNRLKATDDVDLLLAVMPRYIREEIENRETEADQYFRKGWGKMYLMR